MKLGNWLVEKLNPGQRFIAQDEGPAPSVEPELSYIYYYENIEIVNRAVNMVVDDAAEINYRVFPETKVKYPAKKGVKAKTVIELLNVQANPYQDLYAFRRNLAMDLMLDGNAFIYFDGIHTYHLPATMVEIVPDKNTFIEKYIFDGRLDYYPDEVIHIKDNNTKSIYRGASRLKPALRTMKLMKRMRDFQDNFFKNGAVPGLVIKTPDVLSQRIKERMKQDWAVSYKPESGGKRPMILDGGMEIDSISKINFQELDFSASVSDNEKTIMKAIGVPPVLIDSGNNANLRPNHRLYYLETIVPIVEKICSAYQNFFGFGIKSDYSNIPALQPELKDEANYVSTLVNGGVISPNEGREVIGKEPMEGMDEIRVPANIAGSASNPSEGGKPPKDTSND